METISLETISLETISSEKQLQTLTSINKFSIFIGSFSHFLFQINFNYLTLCFRRPISVFCNPPPRTHWHHSSRFRSVCRVFSSMSRFSVVNDFSQCCAECDLVCSSSIGSDLDSNWVLGFGLVAPLSLLPSKTIAYHWWPSSNFVIDGLNWGRHSNDRFEMDSVRNLCSCLVAIWQLHWMHDHRHRSGSPPSCQDVCESWPPSVVNCWHLCSAVSHPNVLSLPPVLFALQAAFDDPLIHSTKADASSSIPILPISLLSFAIGRGFDRCPLHGNVIDLWEKMNCFAFRWWLWNVVLSGDHCARAQTRWMLESMPFPAFLTNKSQNFNEKESNGLVNIPRLLRRSSVNASISIRSNVSLNLKFQPFRSNFLNQIVLIFQANLSKNKRNTYRLLVKRRKRLRNFLSNVKPDRSNSFFMRHNDADVCRSIFSSKSFNSIFHAGILFGLAFFLNTFSIECAMKW